MNYRPRRIETLGSDRVGEVRVKRYGLALGVPMPRPEVLAAGKDATRRVLQGVDPARGVAISLVHQGVDTCSYTTAWWDASHRLNLRLSGAPLSAPTAVRAAPPDHGPDLWELAPLWYERDAWVRHVLEPVQADLDAWLADGFRGQA